jgi:hypothetical protein
VSLALDRERMLEEIDRVMMQTHSMRSKIINKTVSSIAHHFKAPLN